MNRKHKSDLVILFATLALMALGLIIIYAIGPMRANVLNNTYGTDYDSNYFFLGQLRSVALSLIAFFAAFNAFLSFPFIIAVPSSGSRQRNFENAFIM